MPGVYKVESSPQGGGEIKIKEFENQKKIKSLKKTKQKKKIWFFLD